LSRRARAGDGLRWGLAPPVDESGFGESAASIAQEAAASVQQEGVVIEQVVREGQAAKVLVEEARDADLLVVGSRGLGGFSGLLLGSVSQQCAHYARCPVVIVRGRGEED
jgi:nucleotide-binding universal stress UspA family protein